MEKVSRCQHRQAPVGFSQVLRQSPHGKSLHAARQARGVAQVIARQRPPATAEPERTLLQAAGASTETTRDEGDEGNVPRPPVEITSGWDAAGRRAVWMAKILFSQTFWNGFFEVNVFSFYSFFMWFSWFSLVFRGFRKSRVLLFMSFLLEVFNPDDQLEHTIPTGRPEGQDGLLDHFTELENGDQTGKILKLRHVSPYFQMKSTENTAHTALFRIGLRC